MQQINKQLASLLDKEMDRRDFLVHIGAGLVAVTGVAAILKALNSVGSGSSGRSSSGTYGFSNYGSIKPKI